MANWVVVQAIIVEPSRALSNGTLLARPSGLLAGWHIVDEDRMAEGPGPLCGRRFHPGSGKKPISDWDRIPGAFKCRQCATLWDHLAS